MNFEKFTNCVLQQRETICNAFKTIAMAIGQADSSLAADIEAVNDWLETDFDSAISVFRHQLHIVLGQRPNPGDEISLYFRNHHPKLEPTQLKRVTRIARAVSTKSLDAFKKDFEQPQSFWGTRDTSLISLIDDGPQEDKWGLVRHRICSIIVSERVDDEATRLREDSSIECKRGDTYKAWSIRNSLGPHLDRLDEEKKRKAYTAFVQTYRLGEKLRVLNLGLAVGFDHSGNDAITRLSKRECEALKAYIDTLSLRRALDGVAEMIRKLIDHTCSNPNALLGGFVHPAITQMAYAPQLQDMEICSEAESILPHIAVIGDSCQLKTGTCLTADDNHSRVLPPNPDLPLAEKVRDDFCQLECGSKEAATLLKLLCFLDRTGIPENMFARIRLPRKSWHSSGKVEQMGASEVGSLDRDVLPILSDAKMFEEAIERLSCFLTVTSNGSTRIFVIESTIHSHVQRCIDDPVKWMLQALTCVCIAFPLDFHLENFFGDIGRSLIQQVKCVLNHYDLLEGQGLLPPSIKDQVIAPLLSASKFLDTRWKLSIVDRVDNTLLERPRSYLHIWASIRRIKVRRILLEGIGEPLCTEGHSRSDPRSNAFCGELILCYANDHIENSKIALGEALLSRIMPLEINNPTPIEAMVLSKKRILECKALHYAGRFSEACNGFGREFSSLDPASFDRVRCTVVRHFVELLSELGRCTEAILTLSPVVQSMEEAGWQDLPRVRRLKLSLADAFILKGSFEQAREIYSDIEAAVDRVPGDVSKAHILRMRIGLARILHATNRWAEAHTMWKLALKSLSECGWGEGFNHVVIYYSLAHVMFELDPRESTDYLLKADGIFRETGRQFWNAGLGTVWLDYLASIIKCRMDYVIAVNDTK